MAMSPLPIPETAGDTYLTRRANTLERAPKGGCRPVLTRALMGLWIFHHLLGGGGVFEHPSPVYLGSCAS